MGAKSDGVILFLLPSSLCLPSCLLSYLTTNILGPGLLPACSVRGECSDAESRALPQCMMLPPVHSLNQHKVRFSPAHRAVSPVEGPGCFLTQHHHQFGCMWGCIGEGHLQGVSLNATLLLKSTSYQGFPHLLEAAF